MHGLMASGCRRQATPRTNKNVLIPIFRRATTALFFMPENCLFSVSINSKKDLDIKKNNEYFLMGNRITVILS